MVLRLCRRVADSGCIYEPSCPSKVVSKKIDAHSVISVAAVIKCGLFQGGCHISGALFSYFLVFK